MSSCLLNKSQSVYSYNFESHRSSLNVVQNLGSELGRKTEVKVTSEVRKSDRKHVRCLWWRVVCVTSEYLSMGNSTVLRRRVPKKSRHLRGSRGPFAVVHDWNSFNTDVDLFVHSRKYLPKPLLFTPLPAQIMTHV